MALNKDSWHEERLLIDGKLVEAEGGATYENINPADESVIGVSADASKADVERAIAAARRAFDETDWTTNLELRTRCLRQLHQALLEHQDDLADITVAEVGAPRMLMGGPQLGEVEAGTVAALIGAPLSVVTGGAACVIAAVFTFIRARSLRQYER